MQDHAFLLKSLKGYFKVDKSLLIEIKKITNNLIS